MLKAKLAKKNGFTLVEMLIVVAIIAILVAISIPLVGTSLDKAREATDAANMRAAKAEATIMYFNEQLGVSNTLEVGMKYDNVTGTFTKSTVKGYNQTTQASVGANKAWIEVTELAGDATKPTTDKDAIFKLEWKTAPTGP